MITTGKRITVVNSSTGRKGAHVRRGSTGFIVDTSNAYLCVIKNKTVLIMPTFITFSRFGFEKRKRCESKWIGVVMPLFDIKETTARKEIDSLLVDTTKLNELKKVIGHAKIATFVTIKMSPLNVLEDESEFSNWMTSAIHSNSFNMVFMRRRNTDFNKKLIKILDDEDLKQPFHLLLLDKKNFLYKASSIFNGKNSRNVFNGIQTLLTLGDAARINDMKKKYAEARPAIPAFMNRLLCTDVWYLALLNNNDIKFRGEELRLAKIVYSVNKVINTL